MWELAMLWREHYLIFVLAFTIGQPLRLKEFKLEVAAPYVYDRFIRAWGMFPHHEQVPLYFEKHIYAYFVLDMHPDYTTTPSSFNGAGGRHSHARPGARRDPRAQPEIETMLRIDDHISPC